MARASAALAPRSDCSGVLFHGMPGGGKTSCAVELAYTHEHAFEQLAWFAVPDEDHDSTDALTRFARALEAALPGVQLDDLARFESGLSSLVELCTRRRLLIVIDDVESLLTESGDWHDNRWRTLVAALSDPSGLSRLVLTSRRLPTDLGTRMRVEAVGPLNPDEALLLARELPHLGALISGTASGVDPRTAHRRAIDVLTVTQGHPTLLELANDQADDSDDLDLLRTWTDRVADGLPVVERLVFRWLCCLEEGDRIGLVLEQTWADAWEQQERSGDPPDVHAAAAVLSPLLSWPRNIAEARNLYSGQPVRTLGSNAHKARRILAGVDPECIVSGPKVRAFWKTIADPAEPSAVVVDRHAIDIAAGRVLGDKLRSTHRRRAGAYDEVADKYRRAAQRLSAELGLRVTPAEVQATTWIYWRREHAVAYHR